MKTVVLVHGGWHGAWCWDRVVDELGPSVQTHALTLSGVGERIRDFRREIDLQTHVNDVITFIDEHGLSDVLLVGHSYGGMVVAGADAARPERITGRIYLDAFVPQAGDSLLSLTGWPTPEQQQMPAPPASFFGLTGADADRVDEAMTPHPSATALQPSSVDAWSRPSSFVFASGWPSVPHFKLNASRAAESPSWERHDISGSHDLMIDQPEKVARLIESKAL